MLSGDSTQFGAVRLGLRPKFIVDLRQRNPSIEYADFVTIDGHTLATSAAAPPIPLQKSSGALRGTKGELLHLFIVPFADDSGVVKGYFRLLVNHRQADAVSRQLLLTEIGVTLLALAIAVALAYLAARLIVRPMLDLAKSAQLVAQGDLTQRTAVTSGDEIGSLAETFNAMSGDLEKTVTKLVRSQTQLKSVADTVGSRSRTVIERVDEQR